VKGPTDARPPFRFAATTRVGFDETDAQGVVYYGRYMPYFDRARVEYLRHLDLLGTGGGREFVMRANRVEYLAPARFDDLVEVYIRVERIGTTSVTWHFEAFRAEDGLALVRAEQVLVQIDVATRRPVAVTEPLRRAVEAFEAGDAPPPAAPGAGSSTASGTVEAVERIVNREGEADEILRQTVAAIARRLGTFCGVRFVEDGTMASGPSAGGEATAGTVVPVSYDGVKVAEIVVGAALGADDRAALDRIALLVSPYCLVGWDIGGETWRA
jgi:acyl-CoA thioester hydrolase